MTSVDPMTSPERGARWLPCALLLLVAACGAARPAPEAWAPHVPGYAPRQRIVDVATGADLAPDEAAARLREARAIYIGEEAGIPWHGEVTAQVLGAVADAGPTVVLGRVPAALQAVLDGWLRGELPDAALEAALRGSAGEPEELRALLGVLRLCRAAALRVVAGDLDTDVPDRGGIAEGPANDRWTSLVGHRVRSHERLSGDAAGRAERRWHQRADRLRALVEEALAGGGTVVVVADHLLTDRGLGVPLPVFEGTRAPFRVVLPLTQGHMSRHDKELRRLSYPDKRADLLWETPTDPHGHGGPALDEARADTRPQAKAGAGSGAAGRLRSDGSWLKWRV